MLGWSLKSIWLERLTSLPEARRLTGTRDLEGVISQHNASSVPPPVGSRKLPEFQTSVCVCSGRGRQQTKDQEARVGEQE